MKTFQIASIIALASIATAQLDKIPSCALNCFVGPLGSDGCATLTDFACHCKKGSELLSKVEPCVRSACSLADQAATLAATETTCKDAGVPIVISVSGAPAATSAAASAATSAAEVVSSVASSAAAVATSAVASAASSAAAAVSSVLATATAPTNATVSATASASASQFTGGAPHATGAVALIGAAALAMLAL